MSRSVLLQLAHDSIQEVIEAKSFIDKQILLQQHPILQQNAKVTLNLYLDDELRGTYTTTDENNLVDNIILATKKASFEDKNFNPITTSEYLSCELELTLHTSDGLLTQKDKPILELE